MIPAGDADEFAAENRILTEGRIFDIQGIADTKIIDQDRSRHAATVDAVIQTLFSLKESNVGGRRPVELFLPPLNSNRMKLDVLIFGRE